MPPLPLTVGGEDHRAPRRRRILRRTDRVGAGAELIICESTPEVPLPNVLSPLYTAVMEWGEPLTESALVLELAMPELFKVPLPRLLAPS